MKNQKGISLISLVVTIIILLILVAIVIFVAFGEDGVIAKAKTSKLDGRYANITDKVKLRETALTLAFAKNQEGEHEEDFINRLIAEGLITSEDDYDDIAYRTIYLGRQSDDSYKYSINVIPGSIEGKVIADAINRLPDADKPGNEHLKNMTLTVETTEPNETVTLPISNTTGLTINWDAETDPNNFLDPNDLSDPTHTYISIGEYEVQIAGTSALGTFFGPTDYMGCIKNLNKKFKIASESKELLFNSKTVKKYEERIVGKYEPYNAGLDDRYARVIKIKSWGENGFSAFSSFGGNIQGTIPLPSRSSFKNITSFNSVFSLCRGLTGSIPAELFANCPNITSFSDTFYDCSSLTGSIPTGLFANCPNVTEFDYTFKQCSGLTGSIPSGLFSNCPNVTSFVDTFSNCSSLTGSIPSGLFFNCPNVISFTDTFYGCISLTGNIPPGLFANCLNVTEFDYTFSYCSSLTGDAPPLWETHSGATSYYNCFMGCTSLANRHEIPKTWGGDKS